MCIRDSGYRHARLGTGELEYFEEFFELQNNQPMNEEQRKYSEDLIRKIQEVK